MKYVTANTLMYDAAQGQILPGETYYVEDDKAERWVVAGVATIAARREAPPAPPPPQPDPEPIPAPAEPEPEAPEEPEDEGDEAPDEPAQLARILELHAEGKSQNQIAHEMGMSRDRVRRVLSRAGKAL